MPGIWNLLVQGVAVFYVVSAVFPLLKFDAWWIRGWDFPRLQLAMVGLAAVLLLAFTTPGWPLPKLALLLLLAGSLAQDAYRIVPYTPLVRPESLPVASNDPARRLSILVANVLQDNENPKPLRQLLAETSPDLVLLLEINGRWMDDLADLRSDYPHHAGLALENTYGIALFSRLELADERVRHLVEPDVPSIHCLVRLASGESVQIHGLHPRPPRPQSGDSTERDAELVLIAREVRDSGRPLIVMGDLNDVAWSHTTRLFRRISGLLDPRIGRGHFPTYPVALPMLRFPLDHIFHSRSLRLAEFRRLPDIGSDHFPMYAEFSLEPEGKLRQEPPEMEEGDLEEARDKVRSVR